MTDLPDIVAAMERLIKSVDKDVNGIPGAPFSGNGGLVSNDTIRAADEARLALSRFKREIGS